MCLVIPEGLVCQACGDEGFTNGFIYCAECSVYAIHRSCLDVTPETYDEVFFWYCADCKSAMNTEEYNDQLETANRRLSELNRSVATAGNGAPQLADVNSNVGFTQYQPARPVAEAVWRGSMNIVGTNYALSEGFIAHISSKACLKVCEEATTLPSLLRMEMRPRNGLWPKSFLESPPTVDNIALYFFPGDPKNEKEFERLVDDMIEKELAMKTTSKNAELLIFASTLLPQPYWRFQGMRYMWGVFRGKGNTSSSDRVKSVDSVSPQSPLSNYR